MKKKYMFGPIIMALVLFVGIVLIPTSWIAKWIPEKRLEEAATSLAPSMFQGTYLQSEMLKNSKYVPLYGSSEFTRWDPFHPSNYFEVNEASFTPFLVGKGGMTSIVHCLNFATQKELLKNKKMVIVVSPQWFVKHGTDEQHFAPNYSPLQAYQLPYNENIDEQVKRKLMKRLMDYETVQSNETLYDLYDAYLNNKEWKFNLLSIPSKAYMSIQEKKDIFSALLKDMSPKRYKSEEVKEKSWEELRTLANEYGAQRSQNSKFYIEDKVYKKKKDYYLSMEGKNVGLSYGESLEYEDFQMMLDILKEANAEPLFVIIPVNGYYYDFTGFPVEGRTDYYTRIKKQITENGFTFADFSDHEYDPYFMRDSIHIGWKGWVYLDEAMAEFLN